ncbi:hypothetical protein H6P81_003055 [Aristolochia fimbriata]|uniref:RING-type domain-containing protein n=1 Tax=Aristolochia fimbriata TaxID=158543 RepID=A0AAV7FER7_ARIFI|nr:hypothetical protein H6P81_003055 [Aristolochia fimbriata]
MGHNEPHWRTNSSFSPPLSRRWDCRFQSDALSNGSHGAVLYGSSLSSHSKGSRSRVSSEQYPPNHHHHSISDGVLSYFGSPTDNTQGPSRWTPPVEKYNSAELSTPSMGGSRLEASPFSQSTGRRFAARVSNSFGSPSPLSESSRWESTKQPISFPSRANFSTKRSFISKPVYPLVFRNPVSDNEAGELVEPAIRSGLTPGESSNSPFWPDRTSSLERKFHRTLADLHELDASPDPSSSSRREGFRWSNASSYDMGFDREGMEITEHVDSENRRLHSADEPKCGLCGRMLWQKSPWSSYRIVRSGDMPIAGVLSCSHVFHADCLEQTTPKSQIHDPPCPVCHKNTIGTEPSSLVVESLQMTLRSIRRNQGITALVDGTNNCGNLDLNHAESGMRRNGSLPVGRGASNSLIRNHFRKRFSFKGKTGKDLFGSKIFCRTGSSSSDSQAGKSSAGCSKTRSSMKALID